MSVKDKIAIVTGAGSGIGRASAERLAREGAVVIASDRDTHSIAETVRRIVEGGNIATAVTIDITDDKQWRDLIESTISHHRRIDILHSHVGVQIEGSLEQVDPDGMDLSWEINVRAHFVGARLVAPHMKKNGGGSIVITSSNSGVLYDREMIAYATTKHAVVAMVKQIALDYAKHNIRVNALCPGWVDTPFNQAFERQMGGRDALENYIREQIPMSRWAAPEEIADAVYFLASNQSSFMTGQALVVDGGECLGAAG